MTTDEFWLARCKLDLHPKVYCECEMEKQKKLAREDEQNKIFNAVDTSKYYIVFDDAWEKFKKEYKKALQAEGDFSGNKD